MRLQSKTTITFLLLSLLPLFVAGFVAYPVAENAMKASLGTSFQQIADQTIDKVERGVYEVYQSVLTWSKLDIMQEMLTGDLDGKLSGHLMELKREYGSFSNIVVLDKHGEIVAASELGLIGQQFGNRALQQEALRGRPAVADVHRDPSGGGWVVGLAFPLRAKFMNNQIIGVLCALWNADELRRLAQPGVAPSDQPARNLDVLLVRRDGLLIAASGPHRPRVFEDNVIDRGLRSAALAVNQASGHAIEDVFASGESLLGYSYSRGYRDYPGLKWGIVVSQDTVTAFAPIRRLNLLTVNIGTVVALVVGFMSVVVSRRMTRPILGIADVAKRVSQGDFSGRADRGSADEMGALAEVFNQMIVDLKRQRDQLVEKDYVESIIANMMNSLLVVDAAGTIRTVNHATLALLGYEEEQLVGQSADRIFPPVLWTPASGVEGLIAGVAANREAIYRAKDGKEIPVLFSASAMRDERGAVLGVVCVAQDLTERKQAEETLAEQAMRDSLTGLYNRRYFERRIKAELARAERSGQPMGILLCDLDRFKMVNDTYGHQVGDGCLKAVAKAILNSVRGIDLVFRWGGDEILVVLPETTREGVRTTADRIRTRIGQVGEGTYPDLDVSTGIALYPEHGQSEDELVRVADLALYIAKKGGNKIHVGAEEYHLDRKSAKVTFRPAVAIQPIMDLESKQIIGYEALSRDPAGKLGILDLFRKYEVIGKLGELKAVCFQAQLAAAQHAGLQTVFLNVDFRFLSARELVPKPQGVDVVLEISELEALHDIETKLEVAEKWRRLGYKFAIDDFGAGFISLPFVARLIPDYIKIDRSTILQAASASQFKDFMTGLVVALRSYAKHGIIAEGIETEHELNTVRDMGVELVQGYLVGVPVNLELEDRERSAPQADRLKKASNA